MTPSITNYTEIQQNEINALKSIYMEDFMDEVVKIGAWNTTTDRSFRLRLKAPSDKHDDFTLTLAVSLPATYPKTIPKLLVSYNDRLGRSTRVAVESVLKSKPHALQGSEMIFELATSIQDTLEDHFQHRTQAVPNLDQERANQEAAANRAAKEAEKIRRKQEEEAQAEEHQALLRMVHQEEARLAKRKIMSSPMPDVYITENEVPGGIQFDRPMKCRDREGVVIAFRTVSRRSRHRKGSVTEIFSVLPAESAEEAIRFLALKECTVWAGEKETELKRNIQELEKKLETLIQMPSHPNVLQPISFRVRSVIAKNGFTGWTINVLTYLAEKGSLNDLLESVGALAVDGTFRLWAVQLIEALDFYHRHGLVHGSIHTHNILLERSETGNSIIKLSDGAFQHQLRTLVHNYSPGTSYTAASALWAPPELSYGTMNKMTDVFQLGIVFLEMLCGVEVQKRFSSPEALIEALSLSRPLRTLLVKMLHADYRKRPTLFDTLSYEFWRNREDVAGKQAHLPLPSRASSLFGPSSVPRARYDPGGFMINVSRYANDFVEAGRLGRGGFGEVVRARNKLDGTLYAIKKVTQKSAPALSAVLSEIILLSRLNHPNVVRYFTAWIEDGGCCDTNTTAEADVSSCEDDPDIIFGYSTGGLDFISSDAKIEFEYESHGRESYYEDSSEENSSITDNKERALHESDSNIQLRNDEIGSKLEATRENSQFQSNATLFIQMELCENKTLRDIIRGNVLVSVEECWRLFRQILEGLAHIHKNGIIHRDLKPENIFIDVSNNVRIGDFGLARPGENISTYRVSPVYNVDMSLTKNVGTAFYVAPEVQLADGGFYDDKVDMYSLGIILFEMCVPMKTGMERVQMLSEISKRDHTLPIIFEDTDKSLQGGIITSLISHKPSQRPSSMELVRSGKVPVQIEDESFRMALQSISDKASPHHSNLVSAIFSQTSGSTAADHTFDLTTMPALSTDDLLLQSWVKDKLRLVFRRHGAVETYRPLLLPSSSIYSNSAVRLLDSNGNLLQLPYDLTLPHAILIAKRPSTAQRSYVFADVYRNSTLEGHPRRHGEADFDIVSQHSFDLALQEAEIIKVVDEVIEAFPVLPSQQMCYHINHGQLLDNILSFCDIAVAKRSAVKEIISKLNIGQWTWSKIRNELRSPSIAVPSISLDELKRFDFRDSLDKVIPRLRTILHHSEHLESIFAHMQAVVDYCGLFNVKHKIYMNPLSSFNDKFYQDNLLFQCIYDKKRRDVLAAGGRYDKLIQKYHTNPTDMSELCQAVGVNLGWEKLLTLMSRYHSDIVKHPMRTRDRVSDSLSFPKRCDVLIESFDALTLRSTGVRLAQELWAHDISAEIDGEDSLTHTSNLRQNQISNHDWVVTMKQDAHCRIRSVLRKDESEVRLSEVIPWLKNEVRDRNRVMGVSVDRTKISRQTSQQDSSMYFSDKEPDARVLISPNKNKKYNRKTVIEDAQSRSQELARSFLDGPIAAIETKDDLFDGIRDTRLSDPDSWRRLIQSAALGERQNLSDVHELLLNIARDSQVNSRNAFIYNIRSRACMYYDLERKS